MFVSKIKTFFQRIDYTNYKRFLILGVMIARPIQRSIKVIFPYIETMSKPFVIMRTQMDSIGMEN